MFFTGSLQEGIATALQQSKCVFCFVTDEQDESQRWETEYLTEDSVASLLRDDAVALRLNKGSEEAGFLAAIFPLPNTPTVVIIKNGDLKEYIVAGTSKDEFVTRATTALRGAQGQTQPTAAPAPAGAPAPAAAPAPAVQDDYDLYDETPQNPPAASSSNPAPQRPASTTPPSAPAAATPAQDNSAARREAQRLEAERKARESRAAASAAATAAAATARETAEAETAERATKEAAETRSHKEALKKARQDAAEEKARILKKIEDDRAERRSKAAERKAAREQETSSSSTPADAPAATLTRSDSSTLAPSTSGASGMTALQVRLLDGSTIRSRFPSTETLSGAVRAWVDGARTDGGREAYRFKVVLAPQPSRRIDDTEEGKTLSELGLSPSSTLILTPVGSHVGVYKGGSSTVGAVMAFLMLPLGLLQWLWGLVSGVFSGLGGRSREEGGAEPVTVREQRKGRFSQFANPDDRRGDHQLYNGNSLNFEPRPDEKKDE